MSKSQKGRVQPKRKSTRRSQIDRSQKAHLNQLAGYHVKGEKMATLGEVLDPSVPTITLSELSEEQRIDLVLSRLKKEPDTFRLGIMGPGVIDKTRAIAEVEARSPIGRMIVEIEQNLLLRLTKTS